MGLDRRRLVGEVKKTASESLGVQPPSRRRSERVFGASRLLRLPPAFFAAWFGARRRDAGGVHRRAEREAGDVEDFRHVVEERRIEEKQRLPLAAAEIRRPPRHQDSVAKVLVELHHARHVLERVVPVRLRRSSVPCDARQDQRKRDRCSGTSAALVSARARSPRFSSRNRYGPARRRRARFADGPPNFGPSAARPYTGPISRGFIAALGGIAITLLAWFGPWAWPGWPASVAIDLLTRFTDYPESHLGRSAMVILLIIINVAAWALQIRFVVAIVGTVRRMKRWQL
jgi:hypothetical protein